MICENCSKEHDGFYGSGRFCSSKCARGFSTKSKRKEISEKVSQKLKGDSRCAWNKGKSKHEKVHCKKCGKEVRHDSKWKHCRNCFPKLEEYRQSLKDNPKMGGYRVGSGRSKGDWHKGSYYDSPFEIDVAKFLEENGINFIRNTKRFYYEWNGKRRYYIPDFYLTDEDLYVEPKGYWYSDKKERTELAIKENKINVIILMQREEWLKDRSILLEKIKNGDIV